MHKNKCHLADWVTATSIDGRNDNTTMSRRPVCVGILRSKNPPRIAPRYAKRTLNRSKMLTLRSSEKRRFAYAAALVYKSKNKSRSEKPWANRLSARNTSDKSVDVKNTIFRKG